MNLSERQIRWILVGVGLGSFALLVTLEIATETDDLSPVDVLVDAVSLLLTIGATVGVALLIQRMHVQHEEKMALIRDLEIAHAEGNGWRTKMQSHLDGIRVEMDKQFLEWGMTAAEREIGMLILRNRHARNPRLRHNPMLLIVIPQPTLTPLYRHRQIHIVSTHR